MLALKKIFSDGMIFQRDTENNISGTADAGEKVSLKMSRGGKEVFAGETFADKNGRWSVTLPAFEGGIQPFSISVSSGSDETVINDVYSGELFHISGQSNMELPMSRTVDPFAPETPFKENPYIREFRAPIVCRFSKTARSEDFGGGAWKSARGADIMDMSATGYYFAADIFDRLHIPVGLVNTSAGGAAVESFMPYDMIRGYKIHDEFLERATRENFIESTTESDMKRESAWIRALGGEDFGLKPSDNMKEAYVPCNTDDIKGLKGFSGRLFFFREFTVPEDFPLGGATAILGTLTDSDTVYINGVKIGETGYMYPPRYYPIENGVLKKGKNVIAVRIEAKNGRGGFNKGKRYCIKSGSREIELSGVWKYAVAAKAKPLTPSLFFQGEPLALYADMLAPALPIKFRALVWYQGETNCGRANLYYQMFRDFIGYYRRECGYEIPVIYTQLCGYEGMCGESDPSRSWAEFRGAQLKCLDIPRTAMAVTLDLGEYNDLHPKNKRGVGKRLAYCAGGLLYGEETVFARCKKAAFKDGCVKLTFDSGVYLKNNVPGAFEAVYSDGTEKCEIVSEAGTCGDVIRVKCPRAEKPKAVRYAWENSPALLALYDLRGVPVSPFETDT